MDSEKFITEAQNYTIGGQNYSQSALGLDRFGQVVGILGSAIEKLSTVSANIVNLDLSKQADIITIVGILIQKTPELLSELVFVLLDTKTAEDKNNIGKFCTPAQMFQIIETSIDQNDIESIKKSFLGVKAKLTTPTKPTPEILSEKPEDITTA